MDVVPEWTLGDRLRKARETAGLDQATLADRLGAARNTVGNYEQGRTRPKTYLIKEWSVITGVDLDWITLGSVTRRSLSAIAALLRPAAVAA